MPEIEFAEQNTAGVRHCPVCGYSSAEEFLLASDRFYGRPHLYKLVRCSSCSLVWLDNPPTPSEMEYHYGPDYDRIVAAAGENSPEKRWRPRRETLARYKRGGAILDIGCSAGSFLASLNASQWDPYGIEISGAMAEKARARSGAQVFVGDVLAAPFAPGTFDAITCFHVFEHLYRPKEVLTKVFEWLKPGGTFYALMPNIDSAGVRIFRSYWYGLEPPRHLYHFSPTSLRNLARSVGLQEVSLTTDREALIEPSTRYIFDDILSRFGVSRAPLATAGTPSVPWRVVRKMYRLTLQPLLLGLTSLAGDGETIHAVFTKEPHR